MHAVAMAIVKVIASVNTPKCKHAIRALMELYARRTKFKPCSHRASVSTLVSMLGSLTLI